MNWALGNRLIVGLLAGMVFGMLVLGYFLYSAYGSYSEIAEKYETQVRELDRLRSLRPYPDGDNLRMEEDQRNLLADQIDKLQSRLSRIEMPLISLTPEQFQDELRRAVSEVAELAAKKGTGLPKDFYLGFQRYRDTLPADHMASFLRRELEAIKFVVCVLLDNRVTRIVEVERNPLSQVDGRFGSVPETTGQISRADNEERGSVSLVGRHPFRIGFIATQPAFRRALNAIATTPQQFYIVDLLNVENEELSGPPRDGPVDPLQDESLPGERIQLIVGDEELHVRLQIQIVDFLDPGVNSVECDK